MGRVRKHLISRKSFNQQKNNTMFRKLLIIIFTISISISLFASEIKIENIRASFRTELGEKPSVLFDIRWNNAWRNTKNHDAAWVFMKFTSPYDHVKISSTGHRLLQNRIKDCPDPVIEVSDDGLGVFIYPSDIYRGDVDFKIEIFLDDVNQKINNNKLSKFSVYGLEMVYIPQGDFTLGSPDTSSVKYASLYSSDSQGKPTGLFTISSEQEIPVGPNKGALYYWSESEEYNGDQLGPIPDKFPKGYDAFYIMKYEITQGQYADFLNHLSDTWTYARSPIGGRDYYQKRGGIRLIDNVYKADNYYRPMNFISWTDGLAFTDWACLRPITELEYEKAARGPSKPINKEFVWGTNNYDNLERYVNSEFELVFSNERNEANLHDKNRDIFGASYYWVMDLSGSVWEKVITIGNSKGRSFEGSHGDGILVQGFANNEDWPLLDENGGGFGYRGGGFYNRTYYTDFNPHSPIGYRYYGAWSGGPRSIAYGYRAGRSAN